MCHIMQYVGFMVRSSWVPETATDQRAIAVSSPAENVSPRTPIPFIALAFTSLVDLKICNTCRGCLFTITLEI